MQCSLFICDLIHIDGFSPNNDFDMSVAFILSCTQRFVALFSHIANVIVFFQLLVVVVGAQQSIGNNYQIANINLFVSELIIICASKHHNTVSRQILLTDILCELKREEENG